MTKDNNLLGKFELSGIPPAPRGVPKIEVSFNIDQNGILTVTAKDSKTGNQNEIKITNDKGRLSQSEIDEMLKKAEAMKKEDDEQLKRIAAKNAVENYVFSMKNTLDNPNVKLADSDKATLNGALDEALNWVDSHPKAETAEYEKKLKDLEKVCNPIISKMYGAGAGAESGMPGGFPGAGANAGFPGAGASSSRPTGASEQKPKSGPTFEDLNVD